MSADVTIEAAADAAKTMRGLRVSKITREAQDIASFELVDPAGLELPPFTAGAHLDVRINDDIRRQYSLCNDPQERHRYVIAVLNERAGRGGSRAMHEQVAVGSVLPVSAPHNRFPLAGREARFHLLLAGGIGVTPMLAMIAELERRASPWHMHYCTRNPARTAFLDRLRPLIAAGKVELHHDDGDPARGLDIARTLAAFEIGAHVYFCGPPGFMHAAKASVSAWPPFNVHYEYFTGADDRTEAVNKPFQVKIKRSGQVFDIPADRSIVAVLRDNGFEIETDCEDGYCGTCITRYLDGEPDHRDTVLGEDERQRYAMICCARAKSPMLVLDL
ncbi:MAG TPA: PDR/VanB family oxidoreductase [Xanthobacteraceae bacterium]|nr:PDR/VanB family oxidoreductase [Xanthobacteraceae bacterium]